MKLQEDLVLMNNAMRSGRCFFIWLTDHRPFVLQQRGSMIRAHWFIQPPSNAVADIFLVPISAQWWEECRPLKACAQCSTWQSLSWGRTDGQEPKIMVGEPNWHTRFHSEAGQGSAFGFSLALGSLGHCCTFHPHFWSQIQYLLQR